MATRRWKAGDSVPVETVLRRRGVPIDLTGTVVAFFVAPRTLGGIVQTASCDLIPDVVGGVRFEPPPYFSMPGIYYGEYAIVGDDGSRTVPDGEEDLYETWEIIASLA